MSSYSSFVTDYNNPELTGHDVRRINNLNHKEYSELRKKAIENGDISKTRHMNQKNAKFYSQQKDGTFTVQKQIGEQTLYIGRFPDEQTSKLIVAECKNHNWQINEVQDLINKYKIKPKNYSIINGHYVIQKSINGVNTVFCTLNSEIVSEDTVKQIVDSFRNIGWNMNYKSQILKQHGL